MSVIESMKRQIEKENAALSADVDDGSLDGNNEILAEEDVEIDKSVKDDKKKVHNLSMKLKSSRLTIG